MKETDFWSAVNPYLEQNNMITIADLQVALGLLEGEAEAVAAHFCSERKLYRIVTRNSWGYIRIDPEEDLPKKSWCGGTIPRSKNHQVK